MDDLESENDAALAVRLGQVDAVFGAQSAAHSIGLGFVPVIRERVDLLVNRRSYFEPPLQKLLAFCRTPGVRHPCRSAWRLRPERSTAPWSGTPRKDGAGAVEMRRRSRSIAADGGNVRFVAALPLFGGARKRDAVDSPVHPPVAPNHAEWKGEVMTATAFAAAGTVTAADDAAAAAAATAATAGAAGSDGSALRLSSAASDPRGCPVSTTSQAAIEHLEQAMWRLASYFGDPIADLDAAIGEDPGWILPYLVKSNALLTMAEQRFNRMAEGSLAEALAASSGRGLQARELAHLAATRACLAGQWRTACDSWDAILVDHPQDLAALLPAHLFDFYRGDSLNLRKRVARVLPDWSPSAPLYSYVLGQYAFGLEECNLYPQALEAGERALALERRDPWAVHAVAHVHEMLGRYEDGAHWLASRE